MYGTIRVDFIRMQFRSRLCMRREVAQETHELQSILLEPMNALIWQERDNILRGVALS